MRIVTWNCRGAFAKERDVFGRKSDELFALDADIAIIQECSKKDADSLRIEGSSPLWYGNLNGTKGVAIFYKSQWRLSLFAPIDHTYLIPLEVSGPENFKLIAVWTVIAKGGVPAYVKMLRESLQAHPDWYNGGDVVMAGDFNSNCQWDKSPHYNHQSLVSSLQEHGLKSSYHLHHSQEQGSETKQTFRSTRKTNHHIDYIFVPHEWIERLNHFEVGTFDQWLRHSDHCPLIIDIASRSPANETNVKLERHSRQ